MQGLLGFKQTIKEEGKFYAAAGDAVISIVDVRDIAAVAVEALTTIGHQNSIYNLTWRDYACGNGIGSYRGIRKKSNIHKC
jgi:uncharacterized protein YbjT (DUF2867 family)